MPITVSAGDAIRGRHIASAQERVSAQALIRKLDYSDIWRGAGTLKKDRAANMRIDMQGTTTATATTPVQHNLQLQIGEDTIAHANVSVSVQTNDPINQTGVMNKVVSALNRSMDSGLSYKVEGSIP